MTGEMTGKTRDDGAAPPALEGAGEVAATRPPARRVAAHAIWAARGRREVGARVGLVRELPPQRGVDGAGQLLCGGGPCRGHTAAPVALWRQSVRTGRQAAPGRSLG